MSINLWGLGITTQTIKSFCACLCLKILLLGHVCGVQGGGKTAREICLLHREEVVLPPAMAGKAAKGFSYAGASGMRDLMEWALPMGHGATLCFALSDLLSIQK